MREKISVYVGFKDLEKVYNKVNRKALQQVLRIYDDRGKLLGEIKSTYVDSLTCFRVNEGESDR